MQLMVKDEKELGSFLEKRDNLYKEKSIDALMAGRIPPIPDEDLRENFDVFLICILISMVFIQQKGYLMKNQFIMTIRIEKDMV
ncbi:hypothetical protein [Lysinibacillus sp. BSL11]